MHGLVIDLTGKRFGKWLVLGGYSRGKWLCRCDCGIEKMVLGAGLRYGRSTKCRACSVSPGRIALDLTGHQYGRWTVISRGPRRKQVSFWNCRCDCGTEQEVALGNLRSGCSGGCLACAPYQNTRTRAVLAGDVFGKWIVLDRVAPRRGRARWRCRCECGTVRAFTSDYLRTITGGCSKCMQRETIADSRTDEESQHVRHIQGVLAKEQIERGEGPRRTQMIHSAQRLGLTLKEIGTALGITRQRVQQIATKGAVSDV